MKPLCRKPPAVRQRQEDGSVDGFELNEQQATAYVQGRLSRLVQQKQADKERRQEEVTRDILSTSPEVEDMPVSPAQEKKAEAMPRRKKKDKNERTVEDLTKDKDLQAFGKAERKDGRTAEQARYAVMAAAWLKHSGEKMTAANRKKARRMGEYVVRKLAAIEKESRFFSGNDFVSEDTLEGYAMVWHEQAAMWKSFVAYPAAVQEAAGWDGRRKVKAENREAERYKIDEARRREMGESDGSFSVAELGEMEDIRSRAVADGTFMKAPNGKPTNLTERQWLQVRTKAFKQWFGDWERAVKLTLATTSFTDQEAKVYLAANVKGDIVNRETGIVGQVNSKQRGKLVSKPAKRYSAQSGFSNSQHNFAATRIKDLFEHALFVGEYDDKNAEANVRSVKRFACPVVIDGQKAVAFITAKETEGHKIYALELDEIEKLGGKVEQLEQYKRTPAPSSEDILAKVNSAVKTYFDDVSKIVDENGEPKVVYHYSPAEFTVFRKGTRGGKSGNGIYFSYKPLAKFSNMDHLYQAFVNLRNPMTKRNAPAGVLRKEGLFVVGVNDAELAKHTNVFDGVTLHNMELTVFEPNQIKSATDNRGTFNADNADITFSVIERADKTRYVRVENPVYSEREARDILTEKSKSMTYVGKKGRVFGKPGYGLVAPGTDYEVFIMKSSIESILSGKHVKESMNPEVHHAAAAVLDELWLSSRFLQDHDDTKGKPGRDIKQMHRRMAEMYLNGKTYNVKLTAKEYATSNDTNTLYMLKVESIKEKSAKASEEAAGKPGESSPIADRGMIADEERIVKRGSEDFSASLRFLPKATVQHEGLTAPVSVRGYAAFVQQIERDMEDALGRFRTMGAKAESRREKALVAVGTAYNLAKATAAYLPRGYRFSIRPYLNRLQVFAELAASGDLDFTQELASQKVRDLDELEGAALNLRSTIDGMVEEYGNKKVNEILSSLLDKTTANLRRWAKDQVEKDMLALLDRVRPKKDKTGKLKGVMDAEGCREMAKVEAALDLSAEELEDKLNALEGQIGAEQGKADSGNKLLELEAEYNLLSTFGNWRDMSLEQAVEAYENLQQRIAVNKWAWQNVLADRRLAQAAVVNEVVGKLGRPGINKAHRAKMDAPAMKRLKSVGNILQSFPQVITALRGLGLGRLATDLENRLNSALEGMKTSERERWKDIEALSRLCFNKGWAAMMNEMHELRDTGVPFTKAEVKRAKVQTDYAEKLVSMTPEERRQIRKEANEAGGVAALSTYSEKAVEEMRRQLEAGAGTGMRGKKRKWLDFKYVESYQSEKSLELSKGQALYVILMYEQPTYTERMERQGYTTEVIEGLRRFVGDEMVEFGYGLRELFAKQGDKLAEVYERQYGVPFPREKNYFAAKFEVPERGDEMVRMLTSFSGQPGASTGFLKQRVKDHDLDLDTTKDALQVFLQGTTLSDTWMATQGIVRDLRAYMRDKAFRDSMMAAMGKDEYNNFLAWVQLLEQGGVREVVNMGAAQTWVDRIYGSTSIATLGLRIQTLFRQIPAFFNGLLGAYDIGIKEWLVTMSRMKRGEAPMTFARMLNSEFMKNRQVGDVGTMKSQAMRTSGEIISPIERALEAAMQPMEWVDARLTATGLVPVWNVYYGRAVRNGSSAEEAEQYAWQRTVECANRASQPIGWVNKSKLGNDRSLSARALTFMLSEDLNKMGLCMGLWKSGHKGAAVRAWLVYGAANATVSLLLDLLTKGFDKDEEDADWWADVAGFLMATLYGPAASCPGISEFVEWLGTTLLQGVGRLTGSEELQKARARASVGRALIDFGGMYRSAIKMYDMLTDDEEYGWSEYTKTAMRAGKAVSVLAGASGTAVGYGCLFLQTLLNPVDFAAKVGDAWFAGEE